MAEHLAITPAKEFELIYYGEFFRDVANRLGHRIMFDSVGIQVTDIPIGGQERLPLIIKYIPYIYEGFEVVSHHKNWGDRTLMWFQDAVNPEDVWMRFVNEYTKFSRLGSDKTRIMLIAHAMLTLGILSRLRQVDYQTLGLDGEGFGYSDRKSVWFRELTDKEILRYLESIHRNTEAMICGEGRAHIENCDSRLNAAHFFAAGYKLFKDIMPGEFVEVGKDDICLDKRI